MTEHFHLPVVGDLDPVDDRSPSCSARARGSSPGARRRSIPPCAPATACSWARLAGARADPRRRRRAAGRPRTGSITVGVVGSRIKDPAAVRRDLLAAGRPRRRRPTRRSPRPRPIPSYFDPVFSDLDGALRAAQAPARARQRLRRPGTTFERSSSRAAITPNLAAHVVGSVGRDHRRRAQAARARPTTPPARSAGRAWRTSTSASWRARRRRRSRSSTRTARPCARCRRYPGHPGRPVRTSIDPRVQRAAESALAGAQGQARRRWWRCAPPPARCWRPSPCPPTTPTTRRCTAPSRRARRSRCSPRPRSSSAASLPPRRPAARRASPSTARSFHNAEGDQPDPDARPGVHRVVQHRLHRARHPAPARVGLHRRRQALRPAAHDRLGVPAFAGVGAAPDGPDRAGRDRDRTGPGDVLTARDGDRRGRDRHRHGARAAAGAGRRRRPRRPDAAARRRSSTGCGR